MLTTISSFVILIFFIFLFLTFTCNKSRIESEISKKQDSIGNNNVEKKELSLITSDNINIKGDCYYNKNLVDIKEPLIILIHQFRSSRKQWKQALIDSLVFMGYKVLTYDIRNHGESGKSKIDDILTNRNSAPKDLEAVFDWANKQNNIDSSKIGVVGTSVGASLALYARYYLKAKSIIGISGGRNTFEALTGINDRSMSMVAIPRINSVFFICGSYDDDCLNDEKYIMNNYVMNPMEIKVYDSDKHGKDLIEQYPEINSLILDWFRNNL